MIECKQWVHHINVYVPNVCGDRGMTLWSSFTVHFSFCPIFQLSKLGKQQWKCDTMVVVPFAGNYLSNFSSNEPLPVFSVFIFPCLISGNMPWACWFCLCQWMSLFAITASRLMLVNQLSWYKLKVCIGGTMDATHKTTLLPTARWGITLTA